MPDATKQDNFYVLQKKNILVHTLAIEKESNIQNKTGWMIKLGGIGFFFFEVWWMRIFIIFSVRFDCNATLLDLNTLIFI